MNRRSLFMRRRVETDLEEMMTRDPMEHKDRIERSFVGADVGNTCAFLTFTERPLIGPLSSLTIPITINITIDYPYQPPRVLCSDRSIAHPNLDPQNGQFMFSLVDPKYWKPIFELKQVLCGLEMVIISPDINYASLKSMEHFSRIYPNLPNPFRPSKSMDVEGLPPHPSPSSKKYPQNPSESTLSKKPIFFSSQIPSKITNSAKICANHQNNDFSLAKKSSFLVEKSNETDDFVAKNDGFCVFRYQYGQCRNEEEESEGIEKPTRRVRTACISDDFR